ncbi:MAG TPA: 50S ribosomal protein L1 [Gemmataceae bacterium]|jgi:large subunit ribosomal protein L1|nr:50S ribosomal protein L1 [Gemmataceae bacterium]
MAKQKATEPEAAEAAEKSKDAAPAKEKKPKEPKATKPASAKAAPDAPAGGSPAPAAAPASTSPSSQAPGEKKKGKQPGIPPLRGKKLRAQMKAVRTKIAKEGTMPVKKAIGLLKSSKRAKFDETVEIHMSLGIDTTQNDQMVRGSVPLPHGIGKVVRVVVFCQGDNVAKAKEAGADFAGSDDLIKKIQGGWLDFDVALATQDMMGVVSRLGKVLGPRGLMPTPKAGTVIPAGSDVTAGVREFKAGKVEYRADKGGNVHAGVGKLSFDEEKLFANVTTFVEQIRAVKPTGVKGHYVKSITLSATMSPGIPVTV